MRLLVSIVFFSLAFLASTRIADQYCGKSNCYKLLNVSADATQAEIKKAYRTQSLKYHPDKNPDRDTTAIYREINRAYETLSNEDLRKTYDEYLENPNQNEYYQYYKFYKAYYAPQVDPKMVVALFVSLVSVLQYVSRRSMYQSAISYVEKTTKFQTMVNSRLKEEQAAGSNMTKEQIIDEIRKTVNIHGGYSPPKVKDLLIVQTVFLPYYIVRWIYKSIRWVVLFWIMKRPYGPEEREYLTRSRLGLNETRWGAMPAEEREQYIGLELWIAKNWMQYLKDMKEKQREMYGNSSKYKQYQRYMKKQR